MLDTLEKAKSWADEQSKIYSNINPQAFMVCTYNKGFIVHNIKFIIDHIDEYKSEEFVYCTDEILFEKMLSKKLNLDK